MSDSPPDPSTTGPDTSPTAYALALCHEIGNLVAAVRLQAHLVDREMSPRELARATLDVDDLCARSAALLALVGPLLNEATPEPSPTMVSPTELVESVRAQMARHVPPAVRLGGEAETDLPEIQADRAVLHHLLQSLLFGAIDVTRKGGAITLGARCRDDAVVFEVEDDGVDEEGSEAAARVARRGRPLVCAVAGAIATRVGGRCEVTRRGDRTRVSLLWPVRSTGS